MNFSGIAREGLVGRVLRAPLGLIPSGVALPVLQGPLRGARWVVGSSDHGCWLGSYEYRKQRSFARHVPSGGVVFDVGANVGFYTLLAARAVGPTGRVVAFEPLEANTRVIRQHLRLNDARNVRVIQAAVGPGAGVVRFAPHASNAMGRVAADGALEVRMVSLDAVVADGSCEVPDVIKIDVEGGELDVLDGARHLLTDRHPAVFLATHGTTLHRACCSCLRELGYDLEAVGDPSLPIDRTDEILALQRSPCAS